MPVILKRQGSEADAKRHRADWLDCSTGSEADPKDHRSTDAAGLLCRPYPELMVVERTADSWVRR